MKKLSQVITFLLVVMAMISLLMSVMFFLSTVVFETTPFSWMTDALPLILIFSSFIILISARAMFRPLKKLELVDARLRQIIDGMSDGLQIISRDWRYLYVNNAIAMQGKTTKEALLGQTMMERYPGIDKAPFFKELERCMRERVSVTMLNKFIFPDGSSGWFRLNMQPVPEGVLILSVDVTEQIEAKNSIEKLHDQLKQKLNQRTNKTSKRVTKNSHNKPRRF